MDKKIQHIIVEGTDGTGKSTLCHSLCSKLESQGHKAIVLDKNKLELANVLTPIMKSFRQYDMDITAYAMLRACREYHKASFEFDGICIHDRSFMSLRNFFTMLDAPMPIFEPFLQAIESKLAMSPIIYCDPGYKISRDRVEQRAKDGERLGHRESLGRDYNELVYNNLRKEFERCSFETRLKLNVDTNALSIEGTLDRVMSFLHSL